MSERTILLATLYGETLIALLAFVPATSALFFSIFSQGMKDLRENYVNKEKELRESISNQVSKIKEKEKQAEDGSLETILLVNLKKLKTEQRLVRFKTFLLNPIVQPILLFAPIILSLVCLLVAFFATPVYAVILIVSSLLFLTLFFAAFILLIRLLVEVKDLFDKHEAEFKNKTLELLTQLNPKTLLVKKIKVQISDEDPEPLEWASDKQYKLKISTSNLEDDVTAKNVETGFEFPNEIKVESQPSSAEITTAPSSSIIRVRNSSIHAKTNYRHGEISVLPLKVGKYEILTWIKGDNVETVRRPIKVKVIE